MGVFSRWASIRDYFCKLKMGTSFQDYATNMEIDGYTILAKMLQQFSTTNYA